MRRERLAIGVDIGGTHITAALIDLQQKKIIPSSLTRMHVNAAGTAEEIIATWSSCIANAQAENSIESICLAMPGPFDYAAGVSLMRGQAKYEQLYQLNIKDMLALTLSCPASSIHMVNDAACFLQGEVYNGAAKDHADKTIVGITLGTGLGSAVYRGGNSLNADMWRWPFKDGIAEDYLCTRWFVQRWKQISGETITGVKELAKDEHTAILFTEFAQQLAAFLSEFITDESADIVVIGGNIARAFDAFGPVLVAAIQEKHPGVSIIRATLGEEASLLGAVSSWLQSQPPFIIR